MATVTYITLECARGEHSRCLEKGEPFGKGGGLMGCGCSCHHTPSVSMRFIDIVDLLADESNGLVRPAEVKKYLLSHNLTAFKDPHSLLSHLYSLIESTERFKKVGRGLYRRVVKPQAYLRLSFGCSKGRHAQCEGEEVGCQCSCHHEEVLANFIVDDAFRQTLHELVNNLKDGDWATLTRTKNNEPIGGNESE